MNECFQNVIINMSVMNMNRFSEAATINYYVNV